MDNCINCTEKRITTYLLGGYACNAIFLVNSYKLHTISKHPQHTKKIAYLIYILYYYYIYTTIYSLKRVFAFLAVQFFCNFLQFLSTYAIFI
jgi:hypothetical protein